MLGCCTFPLEIIGLICSICFIVYLLRSIQQGYKIILEPLFSSKGEISLLTKYGPWALITGSTDGIGKAYACELAKRGINIVLVSRNEEKLRKTAQEIESKYQVETLIIVADFSESQKAVQTVKEKLHGLPINILVNNVGKLYDYPMPLSELAEKDIMDIININIGATTLMCRAFIEDMKTRGRGAIVNISSGSELNPVPFLIVYSATKVYIKYLSEALRHEYRHSGVTLQHLNPFYVDTKMNHYSDTIQRSLLVPDAQQYASYAVRTLGKIDESSGYWSHGIQMFIVKLLPNSLWVPVSAQLQLYFRKEYLQKIKARK